MKTTPRQQLENYYQQRTEKLTSLKLKDVLSCGTEVFWSPTSESLSEVVSRLVEKYLSQTEGEWNAQIQNPEFCLQVIHLKKHINAQRYTYEAELARAHNRLVREFLNRFSTAENGIHWSKLLHQFPS